MLLSSTTDKLSLITDYAGDIDVVVTFIERNHSTGVVGIAERQLTTITTATTTDILAVPGATTERKVESLSIRNTHASTLNDVVLQYNASGTLYEMYIARLLPGERLNYDPTSGFSVVTRIDKTVYSSGATIDNYQSNSANANCTSTVPPGMKIAPSPTSALTRSFGAFAAFIDTTPIGTTGFLAGFRVTGISALTQARETRLAANTNSVTAATLDCFSRATLSTTALDAGTGSTVEALGLIAAGFVYTEASTEKRDAYVNFIFQSEIVSSIVTLIPGTWFELFEATAG